MPRPPLSAILSAVFAFGLWGLLPIYWKQLGHLGSDVAVAQRVIWTLLAATLLLFWKGETRLWWQTMRQPGVLRTQALSAALLGVNWGLFVWGTQHGRILECSLGYFLNPLLNVLIGCLLLGEKLNRTQIVSITLAGLGVGIQMIAVGRPPWIALLLAFTFGFYGLVRRRSSLGPLAGLATESIIALPISLFFLGLWTFQDQPIFGSGSVRDVSLILGLGIITAAPLLGFANAARKLPFSLLGFLQFLAPTGQFIIGYFVYDEPLSSWSLVAFAFIWTAIALFCVNLVRSRA
ncbi:MAG: EamA family transporter RarD [Verrucomicrobia bacterium]|nr:EamA family transporter RarD [Verrucomicrobiota bacterium]